MKRALLIGLVMVALPAAAQHWDSGLAQDLAALEDEIARLAADPAVRDEAGVELATAEAFVDRLLELPEEEIRIVDLERADELIDDVRVGYGAERRGERDVDRDDDGYVDRPDGDGYADDRYEDDGDVEERYVEERYANDGEVDERDLREDARRGDAIAPPAPNAKASDRGALDDADEARERALQAQLDAEHERTRNARLRQELASLQTRETERGTVVTLGDVLFESGKSDLKPGAARTLDAVVKALKTTPTATVAVEGHTDSVGTRNGNIALSQRRAAAVRGYLVKRGIAAKRVQVRGLGPDYPVADNDSNAGRQQNRRVELVVSNDVTLVRAE